MLGVTLVMTQKCHRVLPNFQPELVTVQKCFDGFKMAVDSCRIAVDSFEIAVDFQKMTPK